jgi:hypothetical protein
MIANPVPAGAIPASVPLRCRLLTALRAGWAAPLQENVSLLLGAVERWCGAARLKDNASLLAGEAAPAPSL